MNLIYLFWSSLMIKHSLVVFVSFCLAGCAAGTMERSDTFTAAQTNVRQESKIIEIALIEKAQIQVNNEKNQKGAQIAGAVIGGLLGGSENRELAALGAFVGGKVAGATVGKTTIVDGVSLTYIENGSMLTSAQVGKPCEFAPGTALVITTAQNETRVQPNSAQACVEGSEDFAGSTSKLAGLANLKLNKGSKDELADLERDKQLIQQKTEVMNASVGLQKSTTGLKTEEQRTNNAARVADQEIEARDAIIDRTKAINEGIRSVSEGVGKGAEKGIVGTTIVK
jgi:outer membrane lipoprotein SlyB